jgi:outer membrane murein-binding lipoprotein Lpp
MAVQATRILVALLVGAAVVCGVIVTSIAVSRANALTAKKAALETRVATLVTAVAALQSELDTLPPPAPAGQGEAERYIETAHAVLLEPSGYNGVPIDVALFYTKNGSRVRLVVTLPDGYPSEAGVAVNYQAFEASYVLPAWACRGDARTGPDPYASFGVFQRGGTYFFVSDDLAADRAIQQLLFDNDVFYDGNQGILGITSLTPVFTDHDVWLGVSGCANYNETHCLPDFIVEIVLTLFYQPDIDAWDAHYDAAV